MSTVKISELAAITTINANTSNTLLMGVDIPTGVTGKFTAHTLAQGLYLNEILNVGNNSVVFPNTIAQFSGNSITYLQMNMQNFTSSGSGDFIITADTGTNANSYIDLGINNSTYSDAAYNAMSPYDGYLYVQGSTPTGASGNLVVGTASANANVSIIVGGTTSENVVAKLTKNGLILNKSITFADGTSQNTSIGTSAATYANGAFIQANAVYTQSNTIVGVNLTQNTSITSAFTQANSAYTKANNALANTSGTFAGNLTVAGNLTAHSISTANLVSFVSSITPSTNSLVEIIGSTSGLQQTPSQDGYMIHVTGKDNVPTRVVIDGFGANSYPLLAGRRGRGVAGTPTATANGDVLLRISGNGWGSTSFAPLGVGRIDFLAAENYTDSARGSLIKFYNTTVGTNTINEIASFNADSVHFTGAVTPAKGFVYTPRILQGAQTAITIDFSSDSIIRGTFSTGGVTNTLTNYVAGKVVDVWLTNTAGNGQTITHGCLANNTTTGSTTLTVASGRSALLKYFSVDGDNANTFLAITYA